MGFFARCDEPTDCPANGEILGELAKELIDELSAHEKIPRAARKALESALRLIVPTAKL